MTGLIPLCAVAVGDRRRSPAPARSSASACRDFLHARPEYRAAGGPRRRDGDRPTLLALVGDDRLPRLLERLADEDEFLSPHGLRACRPTTASSRTSSGTDGHVTASVDYEPAESTTALFGGNSNWRGPIWFPVNYLVIGALERYHRVCGDDFTVEFPTGSGQQRTLARDQPPTCPSAWSAIFLPGRATGAAPCSAAASASRATRPGATRCSSTSTSTATTAPGSAPRTRPAGPAWSPT